MRIAEMINVWLVKRIKHRISSIRHRNQSLYAKADEACTKAGDIVLDLFAGREAPSSREQLNRRALHNGN